MPNSAAKDTALSRRALLFGKRHGVEGEQGAQIARVEMSCLAHSGISCRVCEDNCPERAIRFRPQLRGREFPVISAELCTACGECLPVCPVSALSLTEHPALTENRTLTGHQADA